MRRGSSNSSNFSAVSHSSQSTSSTAGRLSYQFAETFMKFQKGKDDPVALGFNYPSGNSSPVPELTRVSNGIPLQPTELESAQRHAIESKELHANIVAFAGGRLRDVQARRTNRRPVIDFLGVIFNWFEQRGGISRSKEAHTRNAERARSMHQRGVDAEKALRSSNASD